MRPLVIPSAGGNLVYVIHRISISPQSTYPSVVFAYSVPTIRALSIPDRQIYAVVKPGQLEAEGYAYRQAELTDGSENATVVIVGRWQGEPPREVCRPREGAAMRQVTEEEATSGIRTYVGTCVYVSRISLSSFVASITLEAMRNEALDRDSEHKDGIEKVASQ
ncbi:hypothetical protein ON010_g11914 [Phytophthora cinnamomi]|nr:hypothetical protein ON010_g11914 [Phytophthora cinnamomi]